MSALTGRLSERDRRIAALAVPALGTLAVEPLYVLVDTAIVGRLGTAPLGGLALASTVLGTLLMSCNFLAYGTTARVAFLTGAGDRRGGAGVGAQALWVCALLGFPMALLVGLAARPVIAALGGSGAVLDAATTYLRISALGMPAVLVALVGHGYLRGLSDTRTPLRVAVVANVVNLVLELVLVYGFHTGVAGSAWGTVVAQWLAAGWFVALVGRRVLAADVRLAPVWAEIRNLLVVGRQLVVRTVALLAVLGTATSAAARVGPATLAGHQIALQVHSFLALALDSLAIPAQALIGTALGAGQVDEAWAMSRRLLRIGVVCGLAVGMLVLATSGLLPRIFTGDAAVVDRATLALLFVAVLQVPSAVAFTFDGILMGGSDFGFLQRAMVVSLVVFAPFAVAVLADRSLGIAGLWAGLLAWMVARAALCARHFQRGAWIPTRSW